MLTKYTLVVHGPAGETIPPPLGTFVHYIFLKATTLRYKNLLVCHLASGGCGHHSCCHGNRLAYLAKLQIVQKWKFHYNHLPYFDNLIVYSYRKEVVLNNKVATEVTKRQENSENLEFFMIFVVKLRILPLF